jgi:hypothetical protein
MDRSSSEHGRKANGGIGRRTAWLCLVVILFNMLAPVSWVAAHQANFDTSTLCHSGAPAPPANGSSHDDTLAAHCPLCLIFAGAVIAPPGNGSIFVPPFPTFTKSPTAEDYASLSTLPAHWRPSPRGPPSPT